MNDETQPPRMAALWDSIGDDYGSLSPFLVDLAVFLVERADLRSGQRVIDLGCGNGHGIVPAARAVAPGPVLGVDFADAMLAAARQRIEAAGVTNVELRKMDVTNLDVPDSSFDVAIASTVFQFVGYSHEALVEWHRILAPGGRLALSIPVQESMQPLNGLMRDFFDRLTPEIQQAWRASGQTPGEGTTPDLQPMCEQAGFRDIDVDDVALEAAFPDFDTWWAHNWTHGSKAFFRNLPPDALDDARAEARRRIEPLLTPTGEVVTTAAMRICTASV